MNTYHICRPKAEGRRQKAEGRRERTRLEGRRFFITEFQASGFSRRY
ncbi:MAG: hypothetical protein F6K39_40860 [Okeania sp. SIO3B3]|nr:hypothetical protein [Okeania sp. SIO3B3]